MVKELDATKDWPLSIDWEEGTFYECDTEERKKDDDKTETTYTE